MEKPSLTQIDFHKAIGAKIAYLQAVNTKYPGTGEFPLLDGIRGSLSHTDGRWQGFRGNDLEVVIDLGKVQDIKKLSAGFLQDQKRWIFLPLEVSFYISDDGQNFNLVDSVKNEISPENEEALIKDFESLPDELLHARYVKVKGENMKVCPAWHPGAGDPSWIFADEVIIQ